MASLEYWNTYINERLFSKISSLFTIQSTFTKYCTGYKHNFDNIKSYNKIEKWNSINFCFILGLKFANTKQLLTQRKDQLHYEWYIIKISYKWFVMGVIDEVIMI